MGIVERVTVSIGLSNFASSAESVGELWFGQVAKCVIQSDFQCPGGCGTYRQLP